MADPLPEFHLGIIGGCMSHQRGTPLNALYHRQLGEMLRADPGVRLRTHVVRDFEASLCVRLDRLLAGRPVDGVLVHLRAVQMVDPACLTSSVWRDGRYHRRLNPILFHRTHAGSVARSAGNDRMDAEGRAMPHRPDAYGDTPDMQDLPPQGLRIAGLRARNFNVALGTLAGLDRWSIAEELLEFDAVEQACRERGVPLFVMGPTPITYSYWADRIVRKGNAAIRRRLAASEVPFALVERARDEDVRSLTRADGFHLSIEGHRVVAEQLYCQGMRDWVAGIVAARVQQPATATSV
jgi:hypothetical protein